MMFILRKTFNHSRYRLKNGILLALGYLFFLLGLIGAFLPVVPTTPFLIIAYFFFSKGYPRFHQWFLSTKLYKKYLEELVSNHTMPLKHKLFVSIPVSISLLTSAVIVGNGYYAILICTVIFSVWAFLFLYIQ